MIENSNKVSKGISRKIVEIYNVSIEFNSRINPSEL